MPHSGKQAQSVVRMFPSAREAALFELDPSELVVDPGLPHSLPGMEGIIEGAA